MPITAAVCNSFKTDVLQGTHVSGDVYKIALFTNAATLNKDTAAYSTSGEVSGPGYSAGGQNLSGFSVSLSGDVAVLDWTSDPSWASATITARGALIYNSSKSNKAVAVLDFGSDITSTNGTFAVTFAATGVVRLT